MNRKLSVHASKTLRLVGASAVVALAGAFSPRAFAALTISSEPTANVNCAVGVCTATAATAVLNVAELQGLLASSSIQITAGADAQNIVIAVPFSWTSTKTLTLDAYRSIEIDQPMAITGRGALTMTMNDGGTGGNLFFGAQGSVTFASTSNRLTIDGNSYRLANSIAQLAANIAVRPRGFHALANSYDASADGSYSRVPIPTEFNGIFEGLGNVISNFSLFDTTDNNVALFAAVTNHGLLRNVRLMNANLLSENTFVQFLAPLVAYNSGMVLQCQASGAVRSDFFMTGGGLVALNFGTVQKCFANVDVSGAQSATVGGLIGNAHGTVSDVYATGTVSAGDQSNIGGLIGYFIGRKVTRAYSTGLVFGGGNPFVGGFMGENRDDVSGGRVVRSYWDLTTSGRSNATGYGDASGITGVTTEQLQAGVPPDFDRTIWAQQDQINGGLPYLIANPPL